MFEVIIEYLSDNIWLADKINATFEFIAGIACFNHCWTAYKDKQVKGVSIPSTMMLTSWGLWNIFYYPALGQWASFMED